MSGGHVRVNSEKVHKTSYGVSVGDVLTFPQAHNVRVIRIEALGERRGPAPEAQALYFDLTPEPETDKAAPAAPRVGGRPTKRDRRVIDSLKGL